MVAWQVRLWSRRSLIDGGIAGRGCVPAPSARVGDRVVGVLILWRLEVDPFGDRTIELLTTLAAQAAIAIQNVELFQQMTRSAEELRALGEISHAVSSSLDLDEVLTTIVARAVQLGRNDGSERLMPAETRRRRASEATRRVRSRPARVPA